MNSIASPTELRGVVIHRPTGSERLKPTTLVTRYLMVIARHQPDLFEYARTRFKDEAVQVILDRRRGSDRRVAPEPVPMDRRRRDRRATRQTDLTLRTESMFVTVAGPAGIRAR
jgi:hypothetical protein